MRIKSRISNAADSMLRQNAIVFSRLLLQLFIISTGNLCGCLGKRSAFTEFRTYEVIVPRIYNRNLTLNVTAVEGVYLPGIILVEFSAFQRSFSIQLIRNRYFISDNYTEKSFGGTGESYHSPQKDWNCYYTGHLVGHPTSKAVFSACSGLRGYLRTDVEDYHVEPWDWSQSGRHYMFRESDHIGLNLTCGHKGQNSNGRIWRSLDRIIEQRQNFGSWMYDNKTRIIELYIVADSAEFSSLRSNATRVFRRVKEVANIINSIYLPMNIFVILVGAEVWEQDKVDVATSADKTLSNFLEYRRLKISPKHRNDNAQLITGHAFSDNVMGKAPIMTMCTLQYSGGVTTDYSARIGPVATALAHQLGHNLGLLHDAELCDCSDNRCIMSAFSGGRSFATKWSECSKLQFSDAFHQEMDYCLFNRPAVTSDEAICGNGVTEDGEDCDCGLPEFCESRCCNATSCKLMANSTCAVGGCCDTLTCQLRPATTACRISAGECDVGEYCDGVGSNCPSDVFSADGASCSINGVASFCYQGKCRTHDSQCKLLWGATGRSSHRRCFEQYNALGNASGNCGVERINGQSSSFKECKQQDAICGLLHCHHLNEKLMFWKENLAYSLPESSVMVDGARHECKGAILDVGLDMPDPGMVPNGAACGKDKACFNQHCLDVRTAFPNVCPDCHGRGICNSIGQCHCDVGYAPPFCDKSGNGGSLHGGPILIHSGISERDVRLIVALCIFFFLILPLLVLLGFCIFRNRRRMKHCYFWQKPEKYRSVDHANNCTTDSFETAAPEAPIEANLLPKVEETNVCPDVPVPTPKTEPATLPIRRPLLPSRPQSVVLRPNPPPKATQAKRASSITTQDISGPQFVSSTNINLESTLPLSKIRRGELRGLSQAAAGLDPGLDDNDVEIHVKTLPNRSSKSRGSRDVGVRASCVDTLPSEPRFSPKSGVDSSVGLRRPHQSLLEDLPLEENVYEEINSGPVCPKIPPPNPPNSQPRIPAAQKPEPRAGNLAVRDGVSSVSAAGVSRTDSSGKSKPKPTGKTGEKKIKTKVGGDDNNGNRVVAGKPRQNSGRSLSRRSSAADNKTSGNEPSNSDSKRPRVPKEQNQR